MIKNAQLDWNDSGTPVSNQFDDVYFSNTNGLEESRYVFIKQNQLLQRWQQASSQDQTNSARFVIAETGFGTGLNFLAVWQEFAAFRQENPDSQLTQLHFISFEKFPVHLDDLIKAHAAWPEMAEYAKQLQAHYPIAIPECHRIVLADGMITLDLWFGDIHDSLPKLAQTDQGLVDAWFLDGFAPSKNKDMWNDALFQHMARLTKTNGTCATFTAAGFVRRGLIDAGFDMKKVKGFGTKREMIAGVLANKKAENNYAPWLQRYPMQAAGSDSSIAIIGGGIASATLALALHRRGFKLELYCEDDKPALGASGNRQGALYPLIAEPNSSLNRFFAPAFLFARQLVKQASQHLDFDHDLCGVTQFAWNDKSKSKLDKMLLNDYPADLLQWLDAKQTSETIGLESDLASIHYPLGGWLCPQQLTQALIYELERQANVTVHFNTQIDSLAYDEQNTKWILTSKQQPFEHEYFEHPVVVVANGYQFSKFEQLSAIAATPVKGQVSHIPTTDNLSQLKTVLCYDGYMTPQNPNNQHHCIGASYDRTHIDNQFDAQAQVSNGERLKQCIPNQAWPNEVDTSDNLSRQGVRSVTRDHLPFVGNVFKFKPVVEAYKKLDPQILRKRPDLMPEIPHYPNLFCMVGLGARGLCSAPLLAEVLASQIAGDPQPLPLEVLEKIHPARMWVRKMLKGRPITEMQ